MEEMAEESSHKSKLSLVGYRLGAIEGRDLSQKGLGIQTGSENMLI